MGWIFFSASSLKQQFVVFAFSLLCCVLSGEATNTNFIVFGLIRPEFEPPIYRTRGEHANHYTTDAVTIGQMSFTLTNKIKHFPIPYKCIINKFNFMMIDGYNKILIWHCKLTKQYYYSYLCSCIQISSFETYQNANIVWHKG